MIHTPLVEFRVSCKHEVPCLVGLGVSGSPQGPDSCTQKFEMKESWNDKKSSGTDRSLPSAEAGPCRGGGGGLHMSGGDGNPVVAEEIVQPQSSATGNCFNRFQLFSIVSNFW